MSPSPLEKFIRITVSGIGIIGLMLIAAGLGIFLGMDKAPVHASVGAKALDIRGNTVDGSPVDTTSLAGDVVVVNFWATWCGPCLRALPEKTAIANEMADKGVRVIGVSGDPRREDLRAYEQANDIGFPTIHEGAEDIMRTWGVSSFPTVIIIGRDGKIVYRGSGRGLRNAVADAAR
ncbi:MAG: TlpA family protein disulfide reductase [Candidatus Sumerlaeia bacterium]|nr:TlpA family protein disulfide reductase [Candidatus Sumerlaeia bacterium]